MRLLILIIGFVSLFMEAQSEGITKSSSVNEPLLVKKCHDFSFKDATLNLEWEKAKWHQLSKLDPGGTDYKSRFKIMYSGKGIYVLFEGQDNKITTTFVHDFENLFEADVFEVFFHPDPQMPLYLEYEINQLEKELVLIIPNLNGKITGWIPWHYEKDKRVIKKISITGGKMESGSNIQSWSAELFFPYQLFSPLSNVPPASGTTWNANFYRLDYDSGEMIKWAWAPIKHSFHEFEKYQSIKFE